MLNDDKRGVNIVRVGVVRVDDRRIPTLPVIPRCLKQYAVEGRRRSGRVDSLLDSPKVREDVDADRIGAF